MHYPGHFVTVIDCHRQHMMIPAHRRLLITKGRPYLCDSEQPRHFLLNAALVVRQLSADLRQFGSGMGMNIPSLIDCFIHLMHERSKIDHVGKDSFDDGESDVRRSQYSYAQPVNSATSRTSRT